MATTEIQIRAGDTEPLEIVLAATGLANLNQLTTATLYARLKGESTNHVDGVACSVIDSPNLTIQFDPVGSKNGGGDAFDAPGTYLVYVLAVWDDGDETRHPGDSDLLVRVKGNYE